MSVYLSPSKWNGVQRGQHAPPTPHGNHRLMSTVKWSLYANSPRSYSETTRLKTLRQTWENLDKGGRGRRGTPVILSAVTWTRSWIRWAMNRLQMIRMKRSTQGKWSLGRGRMYVCNICWCRLQETSGLSSRSPSSLLYVAKLKLQWGTAKLRDLQREATTQSELLQRVTNERTTHLEGSGIGREATGNRGTLEDRDDTTAAKHTALSLSRCQ